MSVSAAKQRANRLNAQKSTGPRTAEGKAASSRNAITHGIFCQNLLVGEEDPQRLLALQHSAGSRFSPRDPVEAVLVSQWVSSVWKLQRVQKAQQQAYEQKIQCIQQRNEVNRRTYHKTEDQLDRFDAASVTHGMLQSGVLERYARYEQRMFSTMLRCMRELRLMKNEALEQALEDQIVQNEATGQSDVNAHNEAMADAPADASADAPADAQNEATDPPQQAKSSGDQGLEQTVEPTAEPAITPEAAAILAQMEKMLEESVQARERSRLLSR